VRGNEDMSIRNNINYSPHKFNVDTRKVKRCFISVGIFIFTVFLSCPLIRTIIDYKTFSMTRIFLEYSKLETYIVPIVISLVFIGITWGYGKKRVFGMEWQLNEDGLHIFQNGSKIKYIPWEYVKITMNGISIKDTRDKMRFPITLPPRLRHNMLAEIRNKIQM
jgi:hypothetical protein